MAAKNKFMNAMKMPAIADIFSSEAERQQMSGDLVTEVPLSELHPFVNHPFEVRDDEDMQKLVDSIKENGVLTNLTVRPRAEGGYEIISGHRRFHAAQLAGLDKIKVQVRNVDDDQAIIDMVDANIQREHISPMEKARAYAMKLEAIFINPDAAADAVCGGISDCLQQAGIRDTDLNEICLFIPGFKNSANAVRDRFPKTRLMVLGDEYNAYYGALGEPGGIAVLSGTGSFAVCRDKKGSWISVGGWGPLFGDKGSGYHMGLMCLDRITQQWDRGSTNTLLQTLALKQLHMESIPSLRQGAYKPDFTREKIAKLSYTVAEAAKAGDIDALRILDEASVCLADLAAAVARRVGNDELPVSLLGGTSHMGDIFTKRFEAALKEKLPQCSYRKPMFEPIVGAALFVMYEIVGRMDSREDFLKNIQAEWGTTYVNG